MQHVFSLLDDDALPKRIDENLAYDLTSRYDPRDTVHHRLKAIRFSRFERPVRFYWFADRVPTHELGFDRVTFKVPGKLEDLLWVEMITGRAFEIPAEKLSYEDGKTVISDLPMWDSPVLVAERLAVPLR
jgi:hypothetical protein